MMRVAVGFGLLMASALLLADNQAAVTCGVAFHVQDHRIVDNCGRQAYFNGVNVANRLKPYYPSAIGFDKRNMKLLQHYGFNLVRLGVFWQAIEPQPGHFDNQYLAHLGRTVSQLAAYHIKVLVDFHQDAYAKPWGFGFPTWAALGHAGAVNIGFPLNFMCGTQLTGQGGKKTVVGNTVCRHWDHFWDNTPIKKGGLGVQDYYMNMLTHVVSYFNQKRYHNIVGYDLLNEPFPGSRWTDCVNLAVKSSGQMVFTIKDSKGCVTFDKTKMTSFTRRAIQAIRKAEPSALAFYEPEVFYDLGVPSHIGPLHFSNTVFNFHNYNKVDMRLPFLNIASQIKKNDSAAFMSEFGASTLNSVELNTMLNLANQFNVSPTYWAYVNNPPYYFWVPPQNNSGSVFGKMPDDPRKQALVFNMS